MPLNTLAMTAVGYAADSILGTIVGNAGEQVVRQARQGVADALRQGGRPVNHELQRAVRQAYLQATLYVCERCGDELKTQLGAGAQMTRSFTPEINALETLSRHIGQELQQVADAAYRLPPDWDLITHIRRRCGEICRRWRGWGTGNGGWGTVDW